MNDESVQDKVLRLWRDGWSHEDIAAEVGMPTSAVRSWTHEMPQTPTVERPDQ